MFHLNKIVFADNSRAFKDLKDKLGMFNLVYGDLKPHNFKNRRQIIFILYQIGLRALKFGICKILEHPAMQLAAQNAVSIPIKNASLLHFVSADAQIPEQCIQIIGHLKHNATRSIIETKLSNRKSNADTNSPTRSTIL